MAMRLSRIKVDMSSFNLIGHLCHLDKYTKNYEFLKLGIESGQNPGPVWIWSWFWNFVAIIGCG